MRSLKGGDWWNATWNPVTGCTPCSPWCDHCWASMERDVMQDRDQESLSLTEMTRHLDRAGVESGQVEENPVLAEVCETLDGTDFESSMNAIMRNALKSLFRVAKQEHLLDCAKIVKACRDDVREAYRRDHGGDRDIQNVYRREYEYRLSGLLGFDLWLWKKTNPNLSLEKVRSAVVAMHRIDLARMDWFNAAIKALSVRFPWLTEATFREVLMQIPEIALAHRARVTEELQALARQFPEVEDVIILDRRGGNRDAHGCVSGEKLLADYEEMRAEERAKPPKERLRQMGVGGIYHKLACRYGIRGRNGRPSWRAAEKRVVEQKKVSGNAPENAD